MRANSLKGLLLSTKIKALLTVSLQSVVPLW
nr:MAG TPA: hypothetical protein [Caudoviricetes sp.]